MRGRANGAAQLTSRGSIIYEAPRTEGARLPEAPSPLWNAPFETFPVIEMRRTGEAWRFCAVGKNAQTPGPQARFPQSFLTGKEFQGLRETDCSVTREEILQGEYPWHLKPCSPAPGKSAIALTVPFSSTLASS